MKITEHEMRGLLAGKCVPGDMKVNEELPAYLVRKFDEQQQKLDALASENTALKGALSPKEISETAVEAFTETAIMDHDWNDCGEWSWVENDTDVIRAVLDSIKPEIPATDAYLNSVRAEGVEMLARKMEENGYQSTSNGARVFAAQLRTGEAK